MSALQDITPEARTFISPDRVCELVPGMTKNGLAQLRFTGKGPKFYKPTPRKVVYELSEVIAWLKSTQQTSTAQK